MSRHLLLVTLGPVQEFIAQARRTRDLWFGSHLLSEVSRAAAAALAQRQERGNAARSTDTPTESSEQWPRLVFPALDWNDPELEHSAGPLRSSGASALAIPNKLLVEIPDGVDPEALAGRAREAATRQWLDFAGIVEHRCRDLIANGAERAWGEQLRTFLEFGAAWAPLPDSKDGYSRTRSDLEREVASRKLLRDFPAWREQRGKVPKSSLDGARETVIPEPRDRPGSLVKRYRISAGEQLDAVGLIKRAGGEPGQFVPISNIALAGWMKVAKSLFPDQLKDVADTCQSERLGSVKRQDLACGRLFAFDAEVFLRDRWTALLGEARGWTKNVRAQDTQNQVKDFGKLITPLLDRMNDPNPYVACLVADGDRMGRALDDVHDVAAHRLFSRRLSHFAEDARRIVEQDHGGVLVYAGGDDVLAFVNVIDALPCAEALRAAFSELVQQAVSDVSLLAPPPTLSVGIGIGHLLESMGHLRSLGAAAERLAKTQRNALAVLLEKRSGGRTEFLASWNEGPAARLRSAAALLQTHLSMKKVHEVQQDLLRMPPRGSLLPGEQAGWAELLRKDVERTLARTGDGEGLTAPEVGLSWDASTNYDVRHALVDQWLSGMLVAQAVTEATFAAMPREKR